MISKEEREKDKAICEAASTDWREGAVEKWHLYCAATHPDRLCHERVLMRANEHFPYEADVKAAAHCRNRLPVYIDALDKIEERMATIEELTRGDDTPESKAVAKVLRILRGEK